MLSYHRFQFSMFGVNTYLVVDEATKEAAVIDPSMSDAYEEAQFDKFVAEKGITVTQVINTHLHLDHCFGMQHVLGRYGVQLKAHPGDATLGRMMDKQYAKFHMRPTGGSVEIDVPLSDGDKIKIGESTLEVIHVPGHTPGGIALYDPQGQVLISGDTLFRGSIGRTDLEGGDFSQLESSIKGRLFTLPGDTIVLPGHNDHTTIAYEMAHNPYVR